MASTRPKVARLGAPLIALLTGISITVVLATLWLPDGPPPWGGGTIAFLAISIALVVGWFGPRPSSLPQPIWAKPFAIGSAVFAIVVPLITLLLAVPNPTFGFWVMGSVAVAEIALLALVIVLTARQRTHINPRDPGLGE